jgi:tetratricopeptide (TPR) repeat protein
MTGTNDDETANHSDDDGKTEVMASEMGASPSTAPEAASEKTIAVPPPPPPDDAGAEPTANPDEEVESGVLELIETTPVPVVAITARMPAQESSRRPPPLPRTSRPSESMPVVPVRTTPATPHAPFARPGIGTGGSGVSPVPSGRAPAHVRVPAVPPVLAPLGRGSSARVPVAPPLPSLGAHVVPLPAPAPAEPFSLEPETFSTEAAIRDARKRVEHASSGDRTTLARAHTELGLLLEVAAGDTAAALAEYRTAHGISASLAAPLAGARRLTPLHPSAPALALLEADLRRKDDSGVHATRALELGMLLRASGPASEKTWQAYRDVLATEPHHPGALRGLEAALASGSRAGESPALMEDLAAHREVMATAFRNDAHLSAWIEVERGHLLEKLGRMDAAHAAFEAALALDGEIGPVRDAYTRHLLVQGQIEPLITAWAAEATLETDGARAARLLYAAGRLASERLDQKPVAIDLFERAVATEDAAASVRRMALRELFRLYEALGNQEATVATGNRLLSFARDSEMAYWHRRLIPPCEALGRQGDVAVHAQHVLAAEPNDEPMREALDRALASLGEHEQRVGIFTEQAACATATHDRIQLLLRAAHIAEHDMERIDLALGALRSAFASDASNADVTDAIVRLLTPATPPSLTDPDDPSRVRSRIDFYTEAAAAASDPTRKIAHLEKLALLWEDEVRAPERALAVFGEILALEPQRRSAILGLARCAGRAGNAHELLRALVLEADQAGDDPFLERSLLLRAADVASKQLGDHDTALALLRRVFNHSGGDPASLRAAFRIHERAGHPAEALAQLRILLAQKNKPQSAYSLQAEIARYLEERLHRTGEALTVWREAHRLEQDNPTPRAEIRRILLASGDFRAVAEEVAALGMATTNPVERAELLLDAAEIYDDRLGDAERAIPLLAEAHAAQPTEMLIVERLQRAYLRTGKRTEQLALLHATAANDPRSQFALAALQAEERDPASALTRLAELSQDTSTCVPALRMLEQALRRTERWNDLDSVLRRQIEYFATIEGKLGAVYELVALEEYGNAAPPEGQPPARDLLAKVAPDALLAHELFVRSQGLFRQGPASLAVVPALRRLAATTSDAMAAAGLHLALGLILEEQDGPPAQKEALVAFVMAVEAWPDSLVAARGAHRLALRLGDHATFLKAAAALGTLELEPASRAARLLEAAHMAGKQADGAQRAFELVCRALGEDASNAAAAEAVLAAVEQGQDAGKATEALRIALDRTVDPDRAARLGAALAHLALRYLGDQTVALEALRRTRKRAPKHAGTLLALAEISNAMGLQAEAAETATAALALSREPAEKLRAAITLAEVHVRMSAFRETARREAHEAEKLAEETGANGAIVARLGAVFQSLGDDASAERVLIQAVVLGSDEHGLDREDHGALDRLCTLFGTGREAGERVARAIRKAMDLAEASGKPRRPEWLAALGKVEATQLGKQREGLARLHEALRLAPGRLEIYQALADAHGTAHDEAIRELTGMLGELGRSAATGVEVAGVFSILARQSRQAQRDAAAAAAEELVAFFGDSSVLTRPSLWPTRAPLEGALARRTLLSVLVGEAHAPLWELAWLLGEPVGKVLRDDPETLGISRDRLTSRASHPLRTLADRVARAFGDLRFDLYIDATATDTPRLLDTDPPAIVLPKGFDGFAEVEQVAALARLLTYVALDVPWLDGVSPGDAEGILVAGLRTVSELWGKGELSAAEESAAASWRPRIAKAASRKVKRGLEDLAARLRPPLDAVAWGQAVRAAGLKAAYVTSGDLAATLRQTIGSDPDLRGRARNALPAALLAEPSTRELITFALSDAATDLRRAAGTT